MVKRRNSKNAFERLVDYLSRRDHSEYELRQKLRRYHEPEETEAAIARAETYGYLSDPEKIAHKVSSRLQRKGKGERFISGYLRARRLPNVSPDHEELVLTAAAQVEKKLKMTPPYSFENKKKILQWLSNRGYSRAVISKVISR